MDSQHARGRAADRQAKRLRAGIAELPRRAQERTLRDLGERGLPGGETQVAEITRLEEPLHIRSTDHAHFHGGVGCSRFEEVLHYGLVTFQAQPRHL